MRRISKTNSQGHVNVALRQAYADENPLDEIAFELGIVLKDNLGFTAMYRYHQMQGQETNHIFTNPRWDLRSNLIRLSSPAHRWFHTNIDAGRVLCLCAKARKAARLCSQLDFDLSELKTCREHIIGWLESVELPPFANCYRDETLCLLAAMESQP